MLPFTRPARTPTSSTTTTPTRGGGGAAGGGQNKLKSFFGGGGGGGDITTAAGAPGLVPGKAMAPVLLPTVQVRVRPARASHAQGWVCGRAGSWGVGRGWEGKKRGGGGEVEGAPASQRALTPSPLSPPRPPLVPASRAATSSSAPPPAPGSSSSSPGAKPAPSPATTWPPWRARSADLDALGVEVLALTADGRDSAAGFVADVKAAAAGGAGAGGVSGAGGDGSAELGMKVAYGLGPDQAGAWGFYLSEGPTMADLGGGGGWAGASPAAAPPPPIHPEPGVILLTPDGAVSLVLKSSSAFGWADLRILVEGIRFMQEKGYPIRGTYSLE